MKARKILVSLAALALVAAISIGGTIAYLTSTDKVENSFTVGKVAITLDEAQVNTDGTAVTPAARVKANTYKLMPGHPYTKDPTVHVDAASEDSWIFVKVENGISDIEAAETTGENAYTPIAKQITNNGWAPLEGQTDIYYKKYTASATAVKDLTVFSSFKISDNVTTWGNAASAKITVTAYAVQADGFTTAKAAWGATFGA